ADDEFGTELFRAAVAEFQQFRKFVPRLDVEKRHRNSRGTEGLFREAQDADGVLAARKENGGPLKLCRHFAQDVNGFRFQKLQVVEMVAALRHNHYAVATAFPPHAAWRPHSRLSSALAGSK